MSYTPRVVVFEGQTPAENLDHAADFTGWLPGSDTLASITTVTATAGITVGSSPAPTIAGNTVVLWLTGGTSGASYDITIKVLTTAGRVLEMDGRITITDPTP